MKKKKTEPGKTPCPRNCGGHTVWHGRYPNHWFDCSNPKCKWTTNPK